ncbi:MAG: phytanoyl-CoA dioxygenase family protein [Candidatus Hodarchaeales archaeon]
MENSEILKKIKKYGYCMIPKFTNEEVTIIKNELIEIYDTMPDYSALYSRKTLEENVYSYGKHLRFGSLNEIPKFRDIFLSKNLTTITKGYLGDTCVENLQIFATYEYKILEEGKDKPRNSYWHFDPYHSLKYFIYLTDTTIENGCLKVMPETIHITKEIRKQKSFADICDKGYDMSQLVLDDSETVNLEAKAGDMVVFDTDLFHVGSNLQKKGAERMVIIVHNRPR